MENNDKYLNVLRPLKSGKKNINKKKVKAQIENKKRT